MQKKNPKAKRRSALSSLCTGSNSEAVTFARYQLLEPPFACRGEGVYKMVDLF